MKCISGMLQYLGIVSSTYLEGREEKSKKGEGMEGEREGGLKELGKKKTKTFKIKPKITLD